MDMQDLDTFVGTVRHTAGQLCMAAQPRTLSLDDQERLGEMLYSAASALDTLHALLMGALAAAANGHRDLL